MYYKLKAVQKIFFFFTNKGCPKCQLSRRGMTKIIYKERNLKIKGCSKYTNLFLNLRVSKNCNNQNLRCVKQNNRLNGVSFSLNPRIESKIRDCFVSCNYNNNNNYSKTNIKSAVNYRNYDRVGGNGGTNAEKMLRFVCVCVYASRRRNTSLPLLHR